MTLKTSQPCPAGFRYKSLPLHPYIRINAEVLETFARSADAHVLTGTPFCRRCRFFTGLCKEDDKIKCNYPHS